MAPRGTFGGQLYKISIYVMGKGSGIFKNVLLLFASLMFVTAGSEMFFRLRAFIMDAKAYKTREIVMDKLRRGDRSSNYDAFGVMVRLSPDERIVFELKPNFVWEYKGAMVSTNSYGFRGKEYPLAKKAEAVRIIGIGDSIMFGQGVGQGENYLSVLEDMLNARHPVKDWEAINSAVPEYNTAIEVETLKTKGLPFSPGIVILGFCSNDIMMPGFVYLKGLPEKLPVLDRYLSLRESFLARYVIHRLNPLEPEIPELPNRYRSIGGGDAVAAALRELSDLGGRHDFDIVAVIITPEKGPVDLEFMRICSLLGIPVIDMEQAIRSEMKRKGIDEYYGSGLTVPDGHPSAATHKMTAEEIFAYLTRSGLIAKHISR